MIREWIIRRLEFHEGCMLKPYKDSLGIATIGIGRNLRDNPLTEAEKKALGNWENGITRNGALMLLRNDINRCVRELRENISFYTELDVERKYALLDMCFQLGINGLLKFKNMLKDMSRKEFDLASMECLRSTYAKQVPVRAKRIAKLIKTGEWSRYVEE